MKELSLEGGSVKALIDTGASHSFIQWRLLSPNSQANMTKSAEDIHGMFWSGKARGWLSISLKIGDRAFSQEICVIDDPWAPQVVLGMDFLRDKNASCQYSREQDVLTVDGKVVDLITLEEWSGSPSLVEPIVATAVVETSDAERKMFEEAINVYEPEDTRVPHKDTFVGSDEQAKTVENIFVKYADVLVAKLEKAGQAKTEPMKLTLKPDVKPFHLPPRPMTGHRKRIMRELVDALVNNMALVPCKSEWAAPAHLVLKADGSYRMVYDYRGLNDRLVKDKFPLPKMQEILDRLKGAKYFSVMDGVEGYHQMKLDEESVGLTAIITPFGTFAPTTVSFGIANAPAHFQREIQKILEKFNAFCMVYLDDIIIFSETFDEHMMHVEQVMIALREANIKIKKSKCRFAQSEVDFLGHKVTRDGVLPGTRKVEALMEMPHPRNAKELMSVLGLANYFRKFVPNYSTIARPLHDLTKKDTPWKWGQIEMDALEKLRGLISKSPVLKYPDLDRPFIIETDASGVGIGAVLLQPDENGVEHPVAFFSCSLNSAQQNYSIADREALAIYAACINWEPYLEGKDEIVVRTDQQALKWIFARQDAVYHDGRTARMVDRIKHLNLKVTYKPGVENGAADLMSRPPVIACSMVLGQTLDEGIRFDIGGESLTIGEWQQKCPETKLLEKLLDDPKLESAETKDLRKFAAGLAKVRGILVYAPEATEEFRPRIVLPKSLRDYVMETFHDSKPYGCHQGRDRTTTNIKARFWWPAMNQDIKEYVKTCKVCAERKKTSQRHGLMQNFELVEQPFERVGIDWIGPLPESKNGNQYVLMIVDHYSHYPMAIPVKRNDAATLVRCLHEKLEAEWGPPKAILSDLGAELRGELAKECYRVFGSVKLSTTAYHPQTNGLVERFNGTFKRTIAKLIAEDESDWEHVMHEALSIYRKTPHDVLGVSPHEILYNVPPRMPFDHLWVKSPDPEADDDEVEMVLGVELSAHMEHRKARRERIRAILKRAQMDADAENKRLYDERRKHVKYQIGDRVWLYDKDILVGKPFAPMKKGPFTVVKQGRTPNNYVLWIKEKEYEANVARMELFVPARKELPPLVVSNPALQEDETQKEHMRAESDLEEARAKAEELLPSIESPPKPKPQPLKMIARESFTDKKEILRRGFPGQSVAGKTTLKFDRPKIPEQVELEKLLAKYTNTECEQLLKLVSSYLTKLRNSKKEPLRNYGALLNEFNSWKNLISNEQWIINTIKTLKEEIVKRKDTLPLEQMLVSMMMDPVQWFRAKN